MRTIERWPPTLGFIGFDGGSRPAIALAIDPEPPIPTPEEPADTTPTQIGLCCYCDSTGIKCEDTTTNPELDEATCLARPGSQWVADQLPQFDCENNPTECIICMNVDPGGFSLGSGNRTNNDCGGGIDVGSAGPWPCPTNIGISYHVDDDLIVNGQVIQPGQFAFHDCDSCPCSGNNGMNGEHSSGFCAIVQAGVILSFFAQNNFAGNNFGSAGAIEIGNNVCECDAQLYYF